VTVAGVLGQTGFVAGLTVAATPSLSTTPTFMRTGRWRFSFTQRVGASTVGASYLFEVGAAGNRMSVNNDLGAIFLEASGGFVSSATISAPQGQAVTVDVDWVNSLMTVTGATTGNGAYAISPASSWPSGTLGIGQDSGASIAPFDGTISSVEKWGTDVLVADVRVALAATMAGAEAGLTGSATGSVAVPVIGVIAGSEAGLTGASSDYAAPSDSAWSGAFTGHATTYPAAPADATGDPSGGLFVSPTVALSVALSSAGPAGGAFSSGSSQARSVPGASALPTGPASGGFADMQFSDPVPGVIAGAVNAAPSGLVAALSAIRFNGTVAAARPGLAAVVTGLRINGTVAGAEAGLVGSTSELPDLAAGFSYLVNSAGAYLTDVNGSLLYGKT
jgi:hypothetical protein